jgi:hypothetical protein
MPKRGFDIWIARPHLLNDSSCLITDGHVCPPGDDMGSGELWFVSVHRRFQADAIDSRRVLTSIQASSRDSVFSFQVT